MAYASPAVREQQVRAYVHAHLTEKLSPAGVAAALGLNASYLNTCFCRRTGECLGDFIHRCKAERACTLLTETEYPVSQICVMLGYFDQSHFTRVFKHICGVTPGQYRAHKD